MEGGEGGRGEEGREEGGKEKKEKGVNGNGIEMRARGRRAMGRRPGKSAQYNLPIECLMTHSRREPFDGQEITCLAYISQG